MKIKKAKRAFNNTIEEILGLSDPEANRKRMNYWRSRHLKYCATIRASPEKFRLPPDESKVERIIDALLSPIENISKSISADDVRKNAQEVHQRIKKIDLKMRAFAERLESKRPQDVASVKKVIEEWIQNAYYLAQAKAMLAFYTGFKPQR